MLGFLERLEAAIRPATPFKAPEDRDMDEFEWELFLKQGDARNERYGELLDKFRDHPDEDRIVAQYMGWDAHPGAPADGDDEKAEAPDWMEALDDIDFDNLPPEPEPDPAREGIDWVRTKHGDVAHPLQHRCSELGIRMHFDAKEHGYKGVDDPDPDVGDMTFKVHCAGAKMAGVLSCLARGEPGPAGFVVAGLKRALALLHEAMAAEQRVEARQLLPDQTPHYRTELHEIRAGIIDLMGRQRRRTD